MKFWQVDAFTDDVFAGNPAAVFLFETSPSEEMMRKIASEMNLSETAFVIEKPGITIRWFTPKAEVNLCGHATLSAAHVLWEEGFVSAPSLQFQSRSGPLTVTKEEAGYTLDFPLQPPLEKPKESKSIRELIGFCPDYAGSNGEDFMVALPSPSSVLSFCPDFEKICHLNERGLLITASDPSSGFDYIYRTFYPKLGVPEDPVTGSANTCLAAYWAQRLEKDYLRARQVSERGGTLDLKVAQKRLFITGKAITVIEGEFLLSQSAKEGRNPAFSL